MRVAVSFDGRPLPLDALGRVQIPPHASEVVHVVTVELDFESGLRSRDDVAFGGGAGDAGAERADGRADPHDEEAQARARGLPGSPARGRDAAAHRHGRGGTGQPLDRPRRERDRGLRKALGARRRPACAGRAAAFESRRSQLPLAAGAGRARRCGSHGAVSFRGRARPRGWRPDLSSLARRERFARGPLPDVRGRRRRRGAERLRELRPARGPARSRPLGRGRQHLQAGRRPALPRASCAFRCSSGASRTAPRKAPLGAKSRPSERGAGCAQPTPAFGKPSTLNEFCGSRAGICPRRSTLAPGVAGVELVR